MGGINGCKLRSKVIRWVGALQLTLHWVNSHLLNRSHSEAAQFYFGMEKEACYPNSESCSESVSANTIGMDTKLSEFIFNLPSQDRNRGKELDRAHVDPLQFSLDGKKGTSWPVMINYLKFWARSSKVSSTKFLLQPSWCLWARPLVPINWQVMWRWS